MSTVKQIHLTHQLPKNQWSTLLGLKPRASDLREVIDYDCDVYTPEGDLLLRFRKNRLDLRTVGPAYEELRKLNTKAVNRGMATGRGMASDRYNRLGQRTKTKAVPPDFAPISNIIGYFDRQDRQPFMPHPYCRQTSFLAKEVEAWSRCLPFIESVSRIYEHEAPEEWARQKEIVDRTSQDFVIRNTVFTTITVNKNWQTATHTDKGDFKGGLSCITALAAGQYRGGYTCFPHYQVGVDIRTADLMLFNSHHMHGNTEILGKVNEWERVSLVLYYREKMLECGSAAEELERAKRNPVGHRAFNGL